MAKGWCDSGEVPGTALARELRRPTVMVGLLLFKEKPCS